VTLKRRERRAPQTFALGRTFKMLPQGPGLGGASGRAPQPDFAGEFFVGWPKGDKLGPMALAAEHENPA